MIEVIPVLDLMHSIAVSGKSGEREDYRPLKTVFGDSFNPIEIALSLKREGARRLYVADLDAIEARGSNIHLVKQMNHIIPVMFDFGVRDLKSFEIGLKIAWQVIVATETLKDIIELEAIFEKFPPSRIVVSIDTKDGRLYSRNLDLDLEELKDKIIELNPQEVILLDLTAVGTQKGFNEKLLKRFQPLRDKLIIGGGITTNNIPLISSNGIKKVLVGSALHQGKFPLYIDDPIKKF